MHQAGLSFLSTGVKIPYINHLMIKPSQTKMNQQITSKILREEEYNIGIYCHSQVVYVGKNHFKYTHISRPPQKIT